MYIYNKVCLSDVLFSPAGVSASVACWSVRVYLDEERVVVAGDVELVRGFVCFFLFFDQIEEYGWGSGVRDGVVRGVR